MECPMSSPFVLSPNASWAYAAISLMGRERVVGKVHSCPEGGFYVQPWGGSEFDGDVFYLGPCAIFSMHDLTEAQALATARALPESAAARVPGWVVATKPPAAPKFVPPPMRDNMIGDEVGIDGENRPTTHVEAIGQTFVHLGDGRKIRRDEWATRVTAYETIPF